MYIVKIQQGIGNQLFQYAFARMLTKITSRQVLLDNVLGFEQSRFHRESILPHLNIKLKFTSDKINEVTRPLATSKIRRKIHNLIPGKERFHLLKDRHLKNFDINRPDDRLELDGIIYLAGYWQSAKVANFCRQELLLELSLKKSLSEPATKLLEQIKRQEESVAIHIRQDWWSGIKKMSNRRRKHRFKLLDQNYYEQAIHMISESNKDPFFFVFCDDNDKVSEFITDILSPNRYYLMPNWGNVYQDYESLILMSRCNNFIISNSTFSWWGAWLSWEHNVAVNGKSTVYIMPNRANIPEVYNDITEFRHYKPE